MKQCEWQSCSIVVWLLLVAASSPAQGASAGTLTPYTCTNLFQLTTPNGYYISSINGISADGGQVVGIEGQFQSGSSYAMLWNNPTSLGINLSPPNSNISGALATNGQLQVGAVNSAVVWSGTADSRVSLNPPGDHGQANGVAGNQIVGVAYLNGVDHALLWTGNDYTVTDLHPSGAIYYGSDALATDGVRQVGYAFTTGGTHAMLWNGTASSAVDLNPTITTFSQALGINGAEQVGFGLFSGNNYHAMRWTGTASSAVDLNPSSYAESEALTTNGTYQVGYADQGYLTTSHAMMWNGTAASALDLSSLVPGSLGNSQALAVDADGNVFGYAVETSGTYAVEWSPVPEPASVSVVVCLGLSLLGRRRIS